MDKAELSMEELVTLALKIEERRSDSHRECLEVFDEEGASLGLVPRLICHRLGLLHKVAYCIITNSAGQMLLQTRGDVKGGRYDISVAGHLSPVDSSTEDAVCRETEEEVGLQVVRDRLIHIATYRRTKKGSLRKPREVNCELRYLYLYELDYHEERSIREVFENRKEQDAVLDIGWHDIQEVIHACGEERVADGLYSSLMHYLLWKLKR